MRQRAVYPPFAKRVNVEHREAFDFLVADVAGPECGVRQEEALGWRETVDFAYRVFFQSLLQGRIGNIQTAVVSDVFAQGQFPIGMDAGQNLDFVEVVNQQLGASLEVLGIFGCPPIVQVAPRRCRRN